MITVSPTTIELAIGATQRFTFSGKTGAEYFVDVPVGAGLCTLTKISATEWDVTRTANGNIVLRGSENPWSAGTIDASDGLTTLRGDGRRQIMANFSYQYPVSPLIGDGFHSIKVGFSNQRIYWTGQYGSYTLFDINNGGAFTAAIGDVIKFERVGSNIKYYKNAVLIDTQANPYPAFDGSLAAGVQSDGTGAGYINRPEISGNTSNYSEALATINVPTPPADMVLLGAEDAGAAIAVNFMEVLDFDKIKVQRCENPSFTGPTLVEYDNQSPYSPFLNTTGLSLDYKFYYYRAKGKKTNGLYSNNWSNIVAVAWKFPYTATLIGNPTNHIFGGLKSETAYKIRGRAKIGGEWTQLTNWQEISTD